jgi:GNAT superfamily N-acetyltransferase
MSEFTDLDLYLRGARTLVASWEAYARGSHQATVQRTPGVAAAVFPNEPERGIYNNAFLVRDLADSKRAEALDAMEAAYARAGVTRFAAWVHESDTTMCNDLERRGYALDSSTRAMGMSLADLQLPRPELEVRPLDWLDYLRVFGLPAGLLAGADHSALHVIASWIDGEPVAAALALDHDKDCGVFNVETLERARRRGLGTALVTCQLHDALNRGCTTASLQSTPMAERVYGAVGFRDLGRILEYVP